MEVSNNIFDILKEELRKKELTVEVLKELTVKRIKNFQANF